MQLTVPELSMKNILVFVSFFVGLNRIFRWKSKKWKRFMNAVYALSFGLAVYRMAVMFGL
jgi:hypothetical protein